MSTLSKIPLPSIDRPFGIELWPIFSKGWEAIFGYPAEEFIFISGETPISTLPWSLSIITAYYAIIFGGKWYMSDKKALKLNALFQIHNVFLTLLSGMLLVLFIEQLSPILLRHGMFHAVCSYKSYTPKLIVLYYLNYLTKYVSI